MEFRHFVLICSYAVAIGMIVCADDANNKLTTLESDPRFDARISELLSKNMLQLSQEIVTAILQNSDNPSEVVSPLSIYTALSILLMGSNGQTFNELMSLLKINDDSYLSQSTWKMHEEFSPLIDDLNRDIPHPGRRRTQIPWQLQRIPISKDKETAQQISIANGIFYQNGYSIRDDFRNAIESVYQSTLQRLDFANKPELSTKFINSWVNEKTKGKIPDIITSPLPPSTKAIIASALYFKGLWDRSFFENATRPQQFYPDGTDRPSITLNMMFNGGQFPFYDSKDSDCRIIGVPFRKYLTTMYIILPNNSSRHRLRQFQATLTADKIQDMISKMEWRTVMLILPKLHITNKVDLKEILHRMGLRSLFSYDQSDLSLISTGVETLHSANGPRQPDATNHNRQERFIFNRFADETNNATDNSSSRKKRSPMTYKVKSSNFRSSNEPLRLKDLVLGKRITKSFPHKKIVSRGRRDIPIDSSVSLKRLDLLRARLTLEHAPNPRLFADELIHQIDLVVNETGTEGAAATITTLKRSGPDVWFRVDTPFLFLIRHEETKLPIFYGTVFDPTY